jgi:hypothetical protein
MKMLAKNGILLVFLLISLPVYGQEVGTPKYQGTPRFKLGITVVETPLFADQREIKPTPKVDSLLIDQMLHVRGELPSWQGAHTLIAGGVSAAGQ